MTKESRKQKSSGLPELFFLSRSSLEGKQNEDSVDNGDAENEQWQFSESEK